MTDCTAHLGCRPVLHKLRERNSAGLGWKTDHNQTAAVNPDTDGERLVVVAAGPNDVEIQTVL